jgi:hypothetical protein
MFSYSVASAKGTHDRLDYFANILRTRSNDSQVYVIGYAGQRAKIGEGLARPNQASDYLTMKWGIQRGRIVTVDGGYRDPVGVELDIVGR